MTDRIAALGAVAGGVLFTGRSAERRQARLKWLSSLRAAIDPAEPPTDDDATEPRARIADALRLAEEISAAQGEPSDDTSGAAITAAAVAARVAAYGARSLAIQARIGAAHVRRLVDEA